MNRNKFVFVWNLFNFHFSGFCFFLYVSIINFFSISKLELFWIFRIFFSEWKIWFSDDDHLRKSDSGSMMVRFDTYDWTDSWIGWVRYDSSITRRWISCSYFQFYGEKRFTVLIEQMVSEILTDSRDLHGLFEESAFQKEQKKWQFTVWYTQYATRRSRSPRNCQR